MTEKVLDSIERIREVAGQLNQFTDEANRVVATVEKVLNEECSIGVSCEVEANVTEHGGGDGNAEGLVETTYLAYTRVHGKFHLAVNTVVERKHAGPEQHREPVSADIKVWSSCSREEKLAALPKLPVLLDEIADRAAEMAEKTAGAAESLHEILTVLNNGNREQKPPARTGRRRLASTICSPSTQSL